MDQIDLDQRAWQRTGYSKSVEAFSKQVHLWVRHL
jgi:hypothetical protein